MRLGLLYPLTPTRASLESFLAAMLPIKNVHRYFKTESNVLIAWFSPFIHSYFFPINLAAPRKPKLAATIVPSKY